jgi:N-acetylglucosaminyldiphosphoundecaprenol N-acetyl-beta-D-mannosaminyltransferase
VVIDMKTKILFDLPFISEPKQNFMKKLESLLQEERKAFIATVNAKHIVEMEKSHDFERALHDATYIVPDGVGIIKASHYYDTPLAEKIPGIELMEKLLRLANIYKKKIYLLGATEEVLEALVRRIHIAYPNITICGAKDGFDYVEDEIVEEIHVLEPDIVFVALGVPMQELFIAKHFPDVEKGIWMGVGGSFDVLSGEVRRAPVLWRNLHLEWLYRMAAQPKRFKQSSFLFKYVMKVLKEKKKWHFEEKPL